MRINEEKASLRPVFEFLGAALLMFIFSLFIANLNIFLISWLAKYASAFMFIGFLGGIVWWVWLLIANSVNSVAKTVALNTLPDIRPAIVAAPPKMFDPTEIPCVKEPAPTMSNNPLDYGKNETALKNHIAYLTGIQESLGPVIKKPLDQFNTDRKILEEQQLALYRMAHQSVAVVKRIEAAFPKIKADLTHVPQAKAIRLPKPPEYKALKDYETFSKGIASRAGTGIARVGANAGPAAAALTVIAIAAVGVVTFQKTVRAMYQTHEALQTFIDNAANDVTLLGIAHAEMVTSSQRLFADCTQLRQLLVWSKTAEQQGRLRAGTQLTSEELQNIQALASYAVIGRMDAGTNI